jgi:hypothetical protein
MLIEYLHEITLWSAEIPRLAAVSQYTRERVRRAYRRYSAGTAHVANVAWWRTWDNAADALLTDASYAASRSGQPGTGITPRYSARTIRYREKLTPMIISIAAAVVFGLVAIFAVGMDFADDETDARGMMRRGTCPVRPDGTGWAL